MEDFIAEDFIDSIKRFADDGTLGGVFLAVPTGKTLEEDETFIEVVLYGKSVYAKPCMSFGSYNVPTREWLEKHKDEIMVWVAFENGNPAHPVYLGVCPNDKKAPKKPYDGYFWKSVDYELTISNTNRNFEFSHREKNIIKYDELSGIELLLGNEPAVLGNKLEVFLTKFISIISSAQTIDQKPLSPATVSQLESLKAEISELKSQKIKIE